MLQGENGCAISVKSALNYDWWHLSSRWMIIIQISLFSFYYQCTQLFVCLWQLLFVHVLQLWSIICWERVNNFFLIDKDMHVTFLFCKQHSGQTLFQNIIPISEVGWHIQPSSTVLHFSGPCSPSHSFPPLSSSVVFQSPPTLSMCHTHFSWIFTPIHGVFRLKLQNCTKVLAFMNLSILFPQFE